MPDVLTIDFSRVEPPAPQKSPERALTDKMKRSQTDLPVGPDLDRLLPTPQEAAPRKTTLPASKLEAAKATFTASGGNIAEVARAHDLTTRKVTQLAAKYNWPVYGAGTSVVERQSKTRLATLASVLENRLFQLADAMGVETKDVKDITEKGLGSRYVAPLTQRSSAFSAVFDRYMRVMALLEPEVFGHDDDPSNPVAAKIRARENRDALGGVDGVDRRLAEFAARVAVSTLAEHEASRTVDADVVDAEVVE